VSEVQTPPPPEQQPTGRQCPRCGAPMTDDQEWCLACGAAVGTRVVSAPGWRTPIVLAGVIVVVAAIAVAIAIVQLADDTDQVAQNPPANAQASPTPPPTTTPAPTVTPEAGATATPNPALPEASGQETPEPEATTTPEPTTTPVPTAEIASWPSGKSGWTVVLASKTSESQANDAADGFVADGIADVGVLNSDDFSSLKSGFWVVYSGVYNSQSEASDALDGIDAKDAYIRRIEPN
jgi:SPOR domain